MILNTGQRTDIPAFYSEWFYNRLKAGYVLVRNPFNEKQVTKYIFDKELIDVICFCTKNPKPMLSRLNELSAYNQFWFVSITPYGKDIEPKVPNKHKVIDSFIELSMKVGINSIAWRYDPILIDSKYTVQYHIHAFESIVRKIAAYTNSCTISFIDLYQKTRRNYPSARGVTDEEQKQLIKAFVTIADKYNIKLYACSEGGWLKDYGIDPVGCMSQEVLEQAIGYRMNVSTYGYKTRTTCRCLLGCDIGAYNSCLHACKYCYANYDKELVQANYCKHDAYSPLLIGNLDGSEKITVHNQKLFKDDQLTLF